MARTLHRLTSRQIKAASKPIGDGGGLWLYPQGQARTWIFRYSVNGRQREMGLGGYPSVTLAEARDRAAEARALRKQGIDPIEHRKAQKVAEQGIRPLPRLQRATSGRSEALGPIPGMPGNGHQA
ncbi:Arm DNA-binding domain-containing protein [Lamprobacter modestohalophilus]|uniref:Arm DNA-binding domain-containing protein n=1 Tax=Lamprobacter modestohalophilus TaxID=1064514 RepID=UPI002ADEBA7D|nr:Arm DNA-binding domain-containing protein [Lamprobacter modestohalophilus]MEA1050515.1 Arm DNA-binding domain-containing protein [Lamprobacter modestohalophilus]